jgi:hypothetical protein
MLDSRRASSIRHRANAIHAQASILPVRHYPPQISQRGRSGGLNVQGHCLRSRFLLDCGCGLITLFGDLEDALWNAGAFSRQFS